VGQACVPEGHGAKTAQELESEIAKLRKELTEVKQEREILKKAAAYFAKESQQGTRS
jgi:transposase